MLQVDKLGLQLKNDPTNIKPFVCYTSEMFTIGRKGSRYNREFVLPMNPFSPDQNLINYSWSVTAPLNTMGIKNTFTITSQKASETKLYIIEYIVQTMENMHVDIFGTQGLEPHEFDANSTQAEVLLSHAVQYLSKVSYQSRLISCVIRTRWESCHSLHTRIT